MQRLWNEGRWLKLIAATATVATLFFLIRVCHISLITNQLERRFAQRMRIWPWLMAIRFSLYRWRPPAFVDMALELLRGEDAFHWWGNIRFEKSFTADRCRLLSKAGMIAVSGGIEVADDAILELISKGVSIPELIPTLKAFAQAGILVHGYLMYGFPGQNEQHTMNSMELVRQLTRICAPGVLARFTTTAHSPVGKDPDKFGCGLPA